MASTDLKLLTAFQVICGDQTAFTSQSGEAVETAEQEMYEKTVKEYRRVK